MQRSLRWFLALGAASLAVGCGKPDPTDESPWMRPGEDCLSCHKAGGEADGKVWSVAGTVYNPAGNALDGTPQYAAAEGAQVYIKDASGRSVTLTANGAGNFYTGETLTTPFQKIAVVANGKTTEMPDAYLPIATGACNSCHSESSSTVPKAKIVTE